MNSEQAFTLLDWFAIAVGLVACLICLWDYHGSGP